MNKLHFVALLGLMGCSGGELSDSGGTDTDDIPADGFGTLSGSGCGQLDEALSSSSPDLLTFTLTFQDGASFDYDALTPDGQEVHDDGNLGGTSVYSEVMAMETLSRCQGAELLKSEAEIVYETEGKKTDLLVSLDGTPYGVSVTRGFAYPPGTPLSAEDATRVIGDKLEDIQESTDNVAAEDAWDRQVLAVLAWDADDAATIESVYAGLDASVKADTVVWMAITDGGDEWIYVSE